ncbi:MAG: SAM-dependent methyltransferase [Actinomycetota bacterium]|nr:SAM-dependent methyltransferase [Actinomycetota bacterium]
MTELTGILVDRIRANGPMPFAEFMEVALYDPDHGYYSTADSPAGWRGDYLTSPELDPSFGTLWTGAFEKVWEACGGPREFTLVEIGPGAGGFSSAVLTAATGPFGEALRFVLVEISEARRIGLKQLFDDDRVSFAGSVAAVGPVVGCVFANEILDNLPVHVIEMRDEQVVELHVDERQGEPVERWLPCSNPELVERARRSELKASRLEVCLAAEEMAAQCARLIKRGAVVFVDYGRRRGREDSLLAYSATGVDDRLLERAGQKDITHHVDWGPVMEILHEAGLEITGPALQRDVLRALGADRLNRELKDLHERAVAGGKGVEAVRATSRRQALAVLMDPSGLGGLQVVSGTRGISLDFPARAD